MSLTDLFMSEYIVDGCKGTKISLITDPLSQIILDTTVLFVEQNGHFADFIWQYDRNCLPLQQKKQY